MLYAIIRNKRVGYLEEIHFSTLVRGTFKSRNLKRGKYYITLDLNIVGDTIIYILLNNNIIKECKIDKNVYTAIYIEVDKKAKLVIKSNRDILINKGALSITRLG